MFGFTYFARDLVCWASITLQETWNVGLHFLCKRPGVFGFTYFARDLVCWASLTLQETWCDGLHFLCKRPGVLGLTYFVRDLVCSASLSLQETLCVNDSMNRPKWNLLLNFLYLHLIIFVFKMVIADLLECYTEKRNSKCEFGQPMKQTRDLFCMCKLDGARCQSQQQWTQLW